VANLSKTLHTNLYQNRSTFPELMHKTILVCFSPKKLNAATYLLALLFNALSSALKSTLQFIYLFIYYTVYTHVKSFTIVKNRKCTRILSLY